MDQVTDTFALASTAHYLKCFNLFQTKCGQMMKNVEILQDHMPQLIQRLFPDGDEDQTSETKSLNILSVGSGEGKMDLMILKIIKEELRKSKNGSQIKMFNRAIEPNEYMCSSNKAAIKNLSSHDTTFEICQETFKEYQERKKDPVKFDIVHFIHSIYYVDMEETLLHCFEKELGDQGCVVCIVDFEGIISAIFLKQINLWPVNKDITRESYETAEKLIQIANENGWKYEVHTHGYSLDVTEVFDPQSTEGNLLLDFLTQTVNHRETADKQLVEETLALINDLSGVVKDGKRLREKKESLIVFYK